MATVTEELLILIKSIGGIATAGEVEKVSAATAASGRSARAASKEHYGFKSALGSVMGIAKHAAGLAGIGGLALGVHEAVKNAQEMQVASTQLGQAIHNNVRNPAEDANQQMKEFAEHLAVRGGFNPVESIQSMTRLLFVTKDTAKAQKDMALASDIARGTHVDLARATRAVMMVEAGRTTGLSRMGIFLQQSHKAQDALAASRGKHTIAEKEAAKIQDQNATRIQGLTTLWQKYGHTTDSYSKTAAGAVSNLKNQVEILTEQLGAKLLPIITVVVTGISHFIRQMMEGKGTGGELVKVLKDMVGFAKDLFNFLKPLWPVLAGIVGVWTLWNVQLKITAAFEFIVNMYKDMAVALEALKAGQVGVALAQVGLNAAFLTSPVFWVIAAIVALAVAFILLWKHVKGFRDFWKDAWKWIKEAFKDTVDWIKDAWKDTVQWITNAWDNATRWIKNAAHNVSVWVTNAWKAIKDAFQDTVKWITNAWNNTVQWITNAAHNAERWITNAFHDVIQWFKANWPYLLGVLTGPFGLAVAWIIKHWDQVKKLPGTIIRAFKSAASGIANAIMWPFKHAFNWVKQHLPSFHVHHIGPIPIPLPSFPGLAQGGVTPYSGAYVVGERGPELVTLPKGTEVTSNADMRRGGGHLGSNQVEQLVKETNFLLRQLIEAVQESERAMIVDGKVLAQAVMRQGLLQQSRA